MMSLSCKQESILNSFDEVIIECVGDFGEIRELNLVSFERGAGLGLEERLVRFL